MKKIICIRIYRDINQIEPTQRDSLLDPEDLQLPNRLIRLCQDSGVENAQYWHCMFYQNRELTAIATFFKMDVSNDPLSGEIAKRIVGITRYLWKNFLRIPMIFCGFPVSCGRSTIRFQKGIDHRSIISRAVAEMEALAEQEGVRILCFREFFPDEVKTTYYLKRRLGAKPIPMWVYLRHHSRFWHFLFKIFSRWLFPEMCLQPLRVLHRAKQ